MHKRFSTSLSWRTCRETKCSPNKQRSSPPRIPPKWGVNTLRVEPNHSYCWNQYDVLNVNRHIGCSTARRAAVLACLMTRRHTKQSPAAPLRSTDLLRQNHPKPRFRYFWASCEYRIFSLITITRFVLLKVSFPYQQSGNVTSTNKRLKLLRIMTQQDHGFIFQTKNTMEANGLHSHTNPLAWPTLKGCCEDRQTQVCHSSLVVYMSPETLTFVNWLHWKVIIERMHVWTWHCGAQHSSTTTNARMSYYVHVLWSMSFHHFL